MIQPVADPHIADNDFLIKLARWDLLDDFLSILGITSRQVRVAVTFKAMTGLAKNQPNLKLLGNMAAAQRLAAFLRDTGPPTPLDQEFIAQAAGVQNLDRGEVVLLAGLCQGAGKFFYTGDKRAIRALSAFIGTPFADKLRGKIVCLEQVLHLIISHNGIGTARANISADFDADTGIANMFVGGSQTPTGAVLTALESECLRIHAESGGLLANYPVLQAATA